MKSQEQNKVFLAFDFGAESAKAVTGQLKDGKLHTKEIYRFTTGLLQLDDHYYWNIYRFYEEIIKSIVICVREEGKIPESIAFDTWGVDFGLLASDGSLLRIPYAYRDPQVVEAMKEFHKRYSPEKIYELTGISMEPFNSLYHLYALRKNNDPALLNSKEILFLPDLLNYLLCGEKKTEFSFATTTQLYNPVISAWENELLAPLGIDSSFMNEVIPPGQTIGHLKDYIAEKTGAGKARISSVCSHDTASAIVVVPGTGDNWAFISSGTWSIMGIETHAPVITPKTFAYNFSNEGIGEERYSLLKNIMGIWLLQSCKRVWENQGLSFGYPELVAMAEKAPPFSAFLDPDYMGFYNPDNMPRAIDQYCKLTKQTKPSEISSYVRIILENLALKYRMVLEQLMEVTGRNIETIHITGGGIQNKLLCQFTANATGKKVIAGPVEGSALGNIFMQAKACGYLNTVDEVREIVRNTFELKEYLPQDSTQWEAAWKKFQEILEPSHG